MKTNLRRWFAYSLRSFFLVLTVLGIWLGYQVNWIHQRHAALDWLYEYGYYARYAHSPKAVPPPASIRLLGETPVHVIRVANERTYTLASLRKLFPEADVNLNPDIKRKQLQPGERRPF